ncbi:peptidase S8/S53 domain-containing protein [Lactarius vividus]|nr:peptidase S8/S53 domain-containing protein [Lactarius vividus]
MSPDTSQTMFVGLDSAAPSLNTSESDLSLRVRMFRSINLSQEQLAELAGPGLDTFELVHSWLGHYPLWVHLGDTEWQLAEHIETNETIIRAVGYSRPLGSRSAARTCANRSANDVFFSLADAAAGTAQELRQGSSEAGEVEAGAYGGATLPQLRRNRVVVLAPSYTHAATDRNALGIGATQPSSSTAGDATPTKRRTSTFNTDGPYLAWLSYMLKQERISQTISVPYSNEEKAYPGDDAIYACWLFGKLGLRGIGVAFASGDYGVCSGNCEATGRSGNVRQEKIALHIVAFAGPFATSGGGTTGGGFLPEQPAVSAYLQNLGIQYQGPYKRARFRYLSLLLRARLCSPFGRGVPDIAAQALSLPIILSGDGVFMTGTSGSTPALLGFHNPWLYGGGLSGINNVTSSSNPGCNTDGFPAVAGWDSVTGLGTPNFERLQKIQPLTLNPKG